MTQLPCRVLAALTLFVGIAAFAPGNAHAETYDTCAGFIETVPTTVTTQGVWCLRKDLSTSITSGAAITVANNNVTIDCNGFKIGGLGAGNTSQATGIDAPNRQNTTVRNCSVRGFRYGVDLEGSGHLVEDNHFDNNLLMAIRALGENNLVQRNRVYDTGGAPDTSAYAIYGSADVIDNTVAGMFATGNSAEVTAIFIGGDGGVIRNNRIRGLTAFAGVTGIYTFGENVTIDDNQVVVPAGSSGVGIHGHLDTSVCSNNVIAGFSYAMYMCLDTGTNFLP